MVICEWNTHTHTVLSVYFLFIDGNFYSNLWVFVLLLFNEIAVFLVYFHLHRIVISTIPNKRRYSNSFSSI